MTGRSELDKETELHEILQLYACGYGVSRIAREMGGRLSHETIQQRIREATNALRARNAEHIDQAFMQQDLAIMSLYERTVDAIKAAPEGFFPEKAIKCAILLMERRARLLGLDRGHPQTGRGAFEWLDKASPADLEKLAASYGIPLPTAFASA